MEQEARTGSVHVNQARLGDFREPKTRHPESLFATRTLARCDFGGISRHR